jgi:hypothetical protein
MTARERRFIWARLWLMWSRTIEEHGLSWEKWLDKHGLIYG